MDFTPILYIIRHGRTSLNSKGCFRGNVNVPLSKEGREDIEKATEFLKAQEANPVFIVSSDKTRATQSAEILSGSFDSPLQTSEQLRAWDLGEFSGKPRNKENLDSLQKYIDNPYLEVPGGESLDCFVERIVPVLEECFCLAQHHGLGFVVAHSSVIHELGNQIYQDHESLLVDPGGVVVVGMENGRPSAKSIFKQIDSPKQSESIS